MMDVLLKPGVVKICGLRRIEDAVHAATVGADLLGMIFAPSTRQVTREQAIAIVHAVRVKPTADHSTPLLVGVFVNASADEINTTASAVGLDLVQLSGEEPVSLLNDLFTPAIKAFRPVPGTTAAVLLTQMSSYQTAKRPPVAVHVEGYHPRAHGGAGAQADWPLVADCREKLEAPVMLAGGLTAANVGEAIDAVRPFGVDVSSGVEDPSRSQKNPALVESFVTNAKAAFQQMRD